MLNMKFKYLILLLIILFTLLIYYLHKREKFQDETDLNTLIALILKLINKDKTSGPFVSPGPSIPPGPSVSPGPSIPPGPSVSPGPSSSNKNNNSNNEGSNVNTYKSSLNMILNKLSKLSHKEFSEFLEDIVMGRLIFGG